MDVLTGDFIQLEQVLPHRLLRQISSPKVINVLILIKFSRQFKNFTLYFL